MALQFNSSANRCKGGGRLIFTELPIRLVFAETQGIKREPGANKPSALLSQSGNGNNGNNPNGFDNNHNGNGFNNGFGDSGVTQAPTQTFVSGSNTNNAGSVTGGGDNSNTCAAQENFNNSGGVLNQPSLQQYASQSGGVLFGAPSFTNAPTQSAPCAPSVQQSASSSSQ